MAEGGALRELLARFSVDVDTKSLTAFEHGVAGVFERLQKFATVFAGMFALNVLKDFVEGTIEQAAGLHKLAAQAQTTTEELQKTQGILKLSAEDAGLAILQMNRRIGEANGGAKSPIEKLGVSLKDAKGELKPASELILELSDKVSALKTPGERTAAVFDVFGRSAANLIKPLSGGRKAAQEALKEFTDLGGFIDEKFIKESVKAEHEMKKFKVSLGALKGEAVSALLPTVVQLAEGFKNLAQKIRATLKDTHTIAHLFTILKFSAVVSGIWKLIGALRALSIATLTNPWVLLIAGAVALFLIIDDLWTLLEGGDSLIGDALGPDKETFVAELKDSFQALKDTLVSLQPAWEELKTALQAELFTAFINGLRNTFEGISVLVQWINKLVEAYNNLKRLDLGSIDFSNPLSALKGLQAQALPEKVEGQMGGAPGQKAVASIPGKLDNSIKIDNRNNINVSVETTSGDAPDVVGKAVGQGVRSELDKQNVNAINAGRKQ